MSSIMNVECVESWEISQEVKRLEDKIDYFNDKIFDAKIQKRSSTMYETLKKEYTRRLNYLISDDIY